MHQAMRALRYRDMVIEPIVVAFDDATGDRLAFDGSARPHRAGLLD